MTTGIQQAYEMWDILPGRRVEASVEAVIDDWEGFRVLLRDHDTDRVFRIQFRTKAMYQYRDELDCVTEWNRSIRPGQGSFFRVTNSELQSRFTADALGRYVDLQHFAIITPTDCIDVLMVGDPHVEFL
jgi:hypothetical protein